MSDTQETLDVELDKRIDAWLASQGRLATPTATTDSGPSSPSDAAELDGLVAVAGLVAEYGFAQATPPAAAGAEVIERLPDLHWASADESKTTRAASQGAWLVRVAAVAILVVALAAGLVVGLGNRGRSDQSTTQTKGLPVSVINELITNADSEGDPYPSQPIQLVETTVGRLSEQLKKAVVGATVQPSARIWIGQLVGDFYGQPSTRSGLFHVDIETQLVSRASGTAGVFGGNQAYPLSSWGTVHDYQIVRPPSGPAIGAMPRQLALDLEHDAVI
ncbi:MAG TPA: hypothetical protein VGP46_00255, partial [Acidimicrobiales bacterium]|nr:hypothetical protein [Acidimicrobiales bacterium]